MLCKFNVWHTPIQLRYYLTFFIAHLFSPFFEMT